MTRIAIALAITFGLTWGAAEAQWIHVPVPGTPRTADGTPNLNAPVPRTPDGRPDLFGVWQRIVPPEARAPSVGFTDQNLRVLVPPGETVPFQPWAAALFQQRYAADGAGSPSERCLPKGILAPMLPPVPFKIVPSTGVIVILFEESNRYRQIFTDLVTSQHFSPPSVEVELGGQALNHFLERGRQDPGLEWVRIDRFPRETL